MVLLQRQQISRLEDDVNDLEQRVSTVSDGYGSLDGRISDVQTAVGNVPDPSADIEEIQERLDFQFSVINDVRECNNRNWEEYVNSSNDGGGGNFEGC